MVCFSLSQKFCNKLTQYVKRFWWSRSPEDAKSIGLDWFVLLCNCYLLYIKFLVLPPKKKKKERTRGKTVLLLIKFLGVNYKL